MVKPKPNVGLAIGPANLKSEVRTTGRVTSDECIESCGCVYLGARVYDPQQFGHRNAH